MYIAEPKIKSLLEDQQLQKECVDYVALQGLLHILVSILCVRCMFYSFIDLHIFASNDYEGTDKLVIHYIY